MKQLEITTNKRLLVAEYENFDDSQLDEKHKITLFLNGNVLKFICKGSDLTEDIAKGLVHSMNFGTDENPDIGYHDSIKDNYWGESALQSFISAIESEQAKIGVSIDLCKSIIFEIL